jgi:hypothetical protein
MNSDDAQQARELLEKSRLHNTSDLNLAAAQVHATLAVEAAVRELIRTVAESQAWPPAQT